MKTLLIALTLLALAAPAFAQTTWPPPKPVNCVTYCTPGGICVTTCD